MSQETDSKRSTHGSKYRTAIVLLIMVVATLFSGYFKRMVYNTLKANITMLKKLLIFSVVMFAFGYASSTVL